LTYMVSSVLENDGITDFHSRSQIKILGFRRIQPK